MTQVLITNDDGIDSPGLHHLALTLQAAGYSLLVAAPATDASGTSASVTVPEQSDLLELRQRELPGLAGVPAYAVAAPPALITLVAIRGGFGPVPRLVVSGINRGANTGHAVLHSGTVGAALTAAANGCPAIALSLESTPALGGGLHWEAATRYLLELLPVLQDAPDPFVLNVNAPNMPAAEVRGLRESRLAAFGAVQTNVERGDGYVQLALTDVEARYEPGTDAAWLADGYATVSAITPIFEVPQVSLRSVVESLS